MAKPNVGDKIYVEGTIYLTHEVDDFQGGACTIKTVESHIEKGNEVSSVEIEEDPGTWYTWTGYLEPRQDEWKKIYSEQKGGPKPDLRPEFNDEHESWGKAGS
jgi:hypothetical protein